MQLHHDTPAHMCPVQTYTHRIYQVLRTRYMQRFDGDQRTVGIMLKPLHQAHSGRRRDGTCGHGLSKHGNKSEAKNETEHTLNSTDFVCGRENHGRNPVTKSPVRVWYYSTPPPLPPHREQKLWEYGRREVPPKTAPPSCVLVSCTRGGRGFVRI